MLVMEVLRRKGGGLQLNFLFSGDIDKPMPMASLSVWNTSSAEHLGTLAFLVTDDLAERPAGAWEFLEAQSQCVEGV